MATNSFKVLFGAWIDARTFFGRWLDKLSLQAAPRHRLVAFALQGSSSIAATSDNAGYITASL
jgi:hypothetical protein